MDYYQMLQQYNQQRDDLMAQMSQERNAPSNSPTLMEQTRNTQMEDLVRSNTNPAQFDTFERLSPLASIYPQNQQMPNRAMSGQALSPNQNSFSSSMSAPPPANRSTSGGGRSFQSGGGGVQAPSEVAGVINSVAKKHGVKPQLLNAIIKQESNFNPTAKSHAGAQGLMQLMPATAKSLGVKNSNDPQQNVDGGTRYIKQQLQKYGDVRLALAAYNAGPGRVDSLMKKHGNSYDAIQAHLPKETKDYVPKILKNMGMG